MIDRTTLLNFVQHRNSSEWQICFHGVSVEYIKGTRSKIFERRLRKIILKFPAPSSGCQPYLRLWNQTFFAHPNYVSD